ncbi:MAG TPA: hypothetical protein VIV12_01550 [Streptosporangiaceae bacterium]
MQLTDEQVAWVVLRVGWRGEDATVALALALATSGGNTSYRVPASTGPESWRVGLWGISLSRYPGLAKFDLTDPIIGARAAIQLWYATGQMWDWCQAWTGQGYVPFLGRARRAVAAPSKAAPIGDTPPADIERAGAATARNMLADPRTDSPLIGGLRPIDLPPHQL